VAALRPARIVGWSLVFPGGDAVLGETFDASPMAMKSRDFW
jgi:hypothetical protein